MKSRIMGVREEEALIVIKVLMQNGYTVKAYQTDDTIVETIIEFWKEDSICPWQE